MRALTPSLTRSQKARSILAKHFITKIVLTYGATEYSYTKTRIKEFSHTEQWWSQKANLLLDDTDKTLHGLDLEGFKAVISYGLITRHGEEYVATAPLWVVGQQRDSYRDRLECSLSLEGTFDRMAKDKASASYTQESTDTNTVKTLVSAIVESTLAPYTHCKAYTITYDSEDDLIDSFIPADGFRINLNDNRLQKIKELLGYTDCVARVEDDAEIHILVPTTSGTTYNYEYRLVEPYHSFFNKRFRRRIVSPNYVVFQSHPSYGDDYTGFAKDASADLTDMEEREFHNVRATSNAQCTNLATARLLKYQLAAEKGAAIVPFMNFGQEAYDYVKITDARAGDNRVGNMGYVTRYYKPGQASMSFGFGRAPLGVAALMGYATESGQQLTAQNLLPLIDSIYSYIEQLIDIVGDKADIDDVNDILLALYEDAYFRKLTVTERLRIPHGTDKYG